jgi:predicted MPP superfamily phosphohydrolase
LTGLSTATTYHYTLVASSGTPFTAVYSFHTSPTVGDTGSVRVWLLGDAGLGNQPQRDVRDAYLAYSSLADTDVMMLLGDNAYWSGTDSEYTNNMFNQYRSVLPSLPVFPVFGNHDAVSAVSSSQTGPYYSVFAPPTQGQLGGVATNTEAYYSFNYGCVHFTVLNSQDVNR